MGNPKVIILDEPTVGLDPIQIIEIRDLIMELGKTHMVIFSSHILSEVQAICDQILMIANGKLVAFGEPEQLQKQLLAPNEIVLTTDATDIELQTILENVEHIVEITTGVSDSEYADEADEEGTEVNATCVFHISQNPEELAAYEEVIAAAAEEGDSGEELPTVTKYVRIGDSQIVYELSDLDYITLSNAAYDDLRHREVIWADFETVTQIDIALEGENLSITSAVDEEDVEAERIWYYGEEELDISGLQSALTELSADSFTDEDPTDKEEIGLTVYLDNENFPKVEIRLYRYDGSLCLAVVDGESVSLVDRSAVMELVEAVQAIVLN